MTLYMIVTADKYELPLYVGTAAEVAAYLGIKPASLYRLSAPSRNKIYGTRDKFRLVKVEVDDDEE